MVRLTSGLYSTENLGGFCFGSGEICWGPEFDAWLSTVVSGTVSEVIREIVGTELEISELDRRPDPAISTAGREGSRR